jgi:photosystem II stability/assembly factor-like uncharacterized protein
MSNFARTTVHLGMGAVFVAQLIAQGPTVALPLILGFQATGSASAWAWGKNLSARDIDTRKFHLFHVNEGNIIAARLPRELSTPVEDIYPGASFLDDQRGFVVWTQDRVSENNEIRFTLATAETLDGGHSWQVRRQRIVAGFTFTGVNQLQFTDSQNGHVIVGTDGAMGSTFKTLLHTRDGGKRWEIDPASQTVVGNEDAPIHMLFRSRSEGWILTAGVHGQPYPNIWLSHTTDGGRSWDLLNKFAAPPVCRPNCSVQKVSPVYFEPGNFHEAFLWVSFGYAPTGSAPVNLSARYRTHAGGASWSAPEKFNAPGSDWAFADFEFGLAQDGSRIFLTSDGGRTWLYHPALSRILSRYKLSMPKKELHRRNHSLWLVAEVGENSVLVHSDDNGSTWQVLTTNKDLQTSPIYNGLHYM